VCLFFKCSLQHTSLSFYLSPGPDRHITSLSPDSCSVTLLSFSLSLLDSITVPLALCLPTSLCLSLSLCLFNLVSVSDTLSIHVSRGAVSSIYTHYQGEKR
jgi:hypothetical protein